MDKNNFDKIIDNAVKNTDFKDINKIIAQTVDKSIDVARGALRAISDTLLNKNSKALLPAENPKLVEQNPNMLRKAKILNVFGISVSAIMAITALGCIATDGLSTGLALLFLGVFPVFFISRGKSKRLRGEGLRLRRYLRELNESTVITIQDLATAVGEDNDFVVEELKNFIKRDIFKEARIIENNSIFILDNKTFRIYKEQADREGHSIYDVKEENIEQENTDEEIKDSEKYFKDLKKLELILTEPMKSKVTELNHTVGKILEFIKRYPQSRETCYRFMSYYLPTTVKLLNSYDEYDKVSVKGENIKSAIFDIQMSMDTINMAFNKFLDNLYETSTFDTKAELKVMKTVMSRDGLINQNKIKE